MINFATNSPQLHAWQARFARMPRWGWIAIFIGVVLPIVLIFAAIVIVGLLSGLAVMLAVAVISMLIAGARRLLHRPADDGRRNVRIVVHSARVIDP